MEVLQKQLEILNLSMFFESELVGSHSDDLETKKGKKKSKYCPTWDMTDEELKAHHESYADVTEYLRIKYQS